MKIIFYILPLLLATHSLSAGAKQTAACYTCDPDAFELVLAVDGGKQSVTQKQLKRFAIYFRLEGDEGNRTADPAHFAEATVAYTYGDHTFSYNVGLCDYHKDDAYVLCVDDGDRGSFRFSKRSTVTNLSIRMSEASDAYDAMNYDHDLRLIQKHPDRPARAHLIRCTEDIKKALARIEEKYDNPRYVCYDGIREKRYFGCSESERPCRDQGMMRFGEYPTAEATRQAGKRCESAQPDPKYIDNPEGRFVCYDYIASWGGYVGCFRSVNTCQSIGKERFGRYPTARKAHEAYLRCQIGFPL